MLFKRALLLFIFLVLLGGIITGVAYWQMQKVMTQPLSDSQLVLEVDKGDTLTQVLSKLAEKDLEDNGFWVKLYAKIYQCGDRILPGEYLLAADDTYQTLLVKLEEGKAQYHSLTLVEGSTFLQSYDRIKSNALVVVEDQPFTDAEMQEAILGEKKYQSMEGLIFADTYFFRKGDSDLDILRHAYQRLMMVLDEEWQGRATDLPYETSYEALIMASIIERETGVPEERQQIAGVFVRRLQRDMLLQTDPTIIYGLGAEFDGNLRSRHLRDKNNLYNTYRHKGLPPTPIALVGREAIHAALHPEDGESLFFVAKGDGTHYFSATLKEHEQAVRKYQIDERAESYRSKPPASKGG